MKTIIKYKLIEPMCIPSVNAKGDWIDLSASKTIEINAPVADTLKKRNGDKVRLVNFDRRLIPLGIAMKLPKGYEAVVLPRSSTFGKYSIIMTNSEGVIDNSYSGNNDEWKFPALAFQKTTIGQGQRICQFRIQLSQNATVWQKLKWLFSSGIRLQRVESLDYIDRGGFGSTDNYIEK